MAEEALLHKQCNTNFSRVSSFNTDGAGSRKLDDFRLELFDELCTWLETELEHTLFTLEQIHQKMISMDKSPDKSLVYSKKQLPTIRRKCTLLHKGDRLMYCAFNI